MIPIIRTILIFLLWIFSTFYGVQPCPALSFSSLSIPCIFGYDGHAQSKDAYDRSRECSFGYDAILEHPIYETRIGTTENCDLFINSAEFLAAENTPRVFWSGGDAARDAAAAWAQANGATTLEMTQAGQQLAQTTKGLDWLTQARPMWVDASRNFAEGSAGDVHVFQSGTWGVSLQSIWRDTEYPTLMQNNNVNNIIYHVITPEGVTVVPH